MYGRTVVAVVVGLNYVEFLESVYHVHVSDQQIVVFVREVQSV